MKTKRIIFFFLLLSFTIFRLYALEAPRCYTLEERELMLDLFDIGIFNFDNKSWRSSLTISSPYYVDLRHIMSHPETFKKTIALFKEKAKILSFKSICGVPYAALPIAASLAYELESPLLMRRTKRKEYGTAKKVEGVIVPNTQCLVIEDVVTTATSMFETIKDLEAEGLLISDCIVLFDRQQGGIAYAKEQGYKVHTLFTIADFMYVLQEEGKIDSTLAEHIVTWSEEHQVGGLNWKS